MKYIYSTRKASIFSLVVGVAQWPLQYSDLVSYSLTVLSS